VVIEAAAQFAVVTLTSHEPGLEDIFLRYYQGDGLSVKEANHVV
jgi:ABC-2 type transport system ATP-binding protein